MVRAGRDSRVLAVRYRADRAAEVVELVETAIGPS
jgi:hypothetical protein